MIEKIYYSFLKFFSDIHLKFTPYFRRFLRFLALPYEYFFMVNWKECKAGRFKVAADFVYIFFVLKYFPDNYSLCRLWEKNRSEWIQYYGSIYDPYNRARLRKEVQRNEYKILFDDKEVCYQLCQAAGLPLPRQFAFIDPSPNAGNFLSVLQHDTGVDKFFIKPVTGRGGEDIFLISFDKGNMEIVKNEKKQHKTLRLSSAEFAVDRRSVIQECVNQNESLKSISKNSLNTMRIATLLSKKGSVILLGAFIRFGHENSIVDNSSSGGIAVGIDLQKGTLKETGYDFKSRVHKVHPTSGVTFKDFKIPFWNEITALAEKTQLTFPYYKLLGVDIAVSDAGPLIIEINASYDNVGLEQKCGPILARQDILDAFMEYDLLSRKVRQN